MTIQPVTYLPNERHAVVAGKPPRNARRNCDTAENLVENPLDAASGSSSQVTTAWVWSASSFLPVSSLARFVTHSNIPTT